MTMISSCTRGASLSCVTLALLLMLHCHHITSIHGDKSDAALTVVENTDGRGGGDDEEEQVDLQVIQPTDQWQTLKPGQAVPAGSHVRLNLQTGQREVRLGEEQLKYWTQEHRDTQNAESLFSPDELKQAMKKIKEDMNPDAVVSKYRPLEELKRDMSQLELLVETDVQINDLMQSEESLDKMRGAWTCSPAAKEELVETKHRAKREPAQEETEIMKRLLEQFNSSNTTTEQRVNILLELEYLVHQVDNAQTLCSMGGLQVILDGLNSSDVRLQENSAFVLGSALSSNPVVQVKAVESGALQTLLTVLATVQPLRVKKKVLFAVASLLRHFPYAQHNFLSHGGLQVLSELFRADEGRVLGTRIVTMLYDMISEKELISQEGLDLIQDASHKERVRQYAKVSLDRELMEKGWCSLVPQLLESTEHDYREKTLRALLAMAPMCLDQYRSDSYLLDSLVLLRDQYQNMVQSEMILGEEDSYFPEMVELLDALQIKIRTK